MILNLHEDQLADHLLQILVNLETVISRIGHHDVPVWSKTDTLQAIIMFRGLWFR